jgi:hypothetical protein
MADEPVVGDDDVEVEVESHRLGAPCRQVTR